ncbi:hypothetical protein PCANC_16952 [Puccinia coronata f. sp. avenae]|uniref:Uncharacterized protein n=1 Tax=Puccinia coronata f. sp. avenae TaxID=200324 RepID=A0A2N5RW55_9BASI|nr:hypothetical protein PCANC_28836 [Puccinia coronata f. sp. avenae]PLW24807.1 hypothetical protein PCASD_26610 [Puccinia coronata f. sp. avenae]PLW45282.1 hypothetical protein PCANC_16952 [Puccinia coronata f. sp. avenae]
MIFRSLVSLFLILAYAAFPCSGLDEAGMVLQPSTEPEERFLYKSLSSVEPKDSHQTLELAPTKGDYSGIVHLPEELRRGGVVDRDLEDQPPHSTEVVLNIIDREKHEIMVPNRGSTQVARVPDETVADCSTVTTTLQTMIIFSSLWMMGILTWVLYDTTTHRLCYKGFL